MFLNPPGPDTTVEESLRMGGRHTMIRSEGQLTRVTTILITRLDPEPPIYEIAQAEFREVSPGKREHIAGVAVSFDDLDQALAIMVRMHHDDWKE
jgi:hypothetical protein